MKFANTTHLAVHEGQVLFINRRRAPCPYGEAVARGRPERGRRRRWHQQAPVCHHLAIAVNKQAFGGSGFADQRLICHQSPGPFSYHHPHTSRYRQFCGAHLCFSSAASVSVLFCCLVRQIMSLFSSPRPVSFCRLLRPVGSPCRKKKR